MSETGEPAVVADEPVVCDRCGAPIASVSTRCQRCGVRLGFNWPGIFGSVAVLGLGTAIALYQRALDWFLFLGGCFSAAAIASWLGWSKERARREVAEQSSGTDRSLTGS